MGFFSKITESFKKISFGAKVDDEYFEELEEQLIMADVGAYTAIKLTEELRQRAKKERITNAKDLKPIMCELVSNMLDVKSEIIPTENPRVILVIGVNGVGKTTTIGKLSKRFANEGKTVMVAAADTFRAAAIEQLTIWAERSGAKLMSSVQGADPAAVVHDAVSSGAARGIDVIICDTAGRLHNKKNLMDELAKIRRVITKELPNTIPEVLLVVDATTGQNAVVQAKQFQEVAGVDGVVLTKLDGTAKGGVVIAIASELSLPVKYVGVGEGIDDIYPFDAAEFAKALFGDDNE